MKKIYFLPIVAIFLILVFLAFKTVYGNGMTFTVCATGCDFTSINEAFASSTIAMDSINVTGDYVYDQGTEGTNLNIPPDITLTCDVGVATIGDHTQATTNFNMNNNTVIDGCTFDNVQISSHNQSNVKVLNNTYVGYQNDLLVFNNVNTFEISNNQHIRNIIMGSSDNGLINNNLIDRYNNNVTLILNAIDVDGNTITDLADDNEIPNNVTISNNIIKDYSTSGGGDWIQLIAGKNVFFTNNSIFPQVTNDDQFANLITTQTIELNLSGNTFVFPDKSGGATNGTWGVTLRAATETPLIATIEHNTFIFSNQSSQLNGNESCVGMYDNVGTTTMTVNYNYNICYNGSGTTGGAGLNFGSATTTSTVNLTESYNGFYNLQNNKVDMGFVAGSINTNDLTTNPVFRLEDADPTNDYLLSPISHYLDVNGTQDIGALNIPRVSTYTIDGGCTIDYTSCFSNQSSLLNLVTRSGDNITLGNGNYGPITLPSGLSNIYLTGGGATVIDSASTSQALSLNNLSNSTITNLEIRNAATSTFSYHMFVPTMTYSGNDYNQIGPQTIYTYSPDCMTNIPIGSPYTVVTGINGIGTSDIGLFLINVGFRLTAMLPNSIGSNPTEIGTNCGQPPSIFDIYLTNFLELQPDGNYTFNSSGLSTAGISIMGTTSPFLNKLVSHAAGVYLGSSVNNTISNITFDGNITDIYLDSSSSGNTFIVNSFSASTTASTTQIYSLATSANNLQDSLFDSSLFSVSSGPVNITYTLNLNVENASSSPVGSTSVIVKNVLGDTINSLTTNASGFVSAPVIAKTVTSSNTLNTKTPLTITVASTTYLTLSTTTSPTASSSMTIQMASGTDPVAPTQTSSGGGFVMPIPPSQNDPFSTTSKFVDLLSTTSKNINFAKLVTFPNLNVGTFSKEVADLQKFLNLLGFTVSTSGPGSVGQETNFFGPLTRSALARFQKAYNINPAAGYFGPITKRFLQSF
jgi:hypothetical protein